MNNFVERLLGWVIVLVPAIAFVLLSGWLTALKTGQPLAGVFVGAANTLWLTWLVRRTRTD